MIKIGDKITSGEQEAVTIPEGSTIWIANPNWDGDDETTHFEVKIAIDKETCMWTCSSSETITGTVLEIKYPPVKPVDDDFINLLQSVQGVLSDAIADKGNIETLKGSEQLSELFQKLM